MSLASLGMRGCALSATSRHCLRAAAASSWAKAVPNSGRYDAALAACIRPGIAHEVDPTRQRCQIALRILIMAAVSPSCASEMTSVVPRRPRRARLRRNSTQNGSASLCPLIMPSASRLPPAYARLSAVASASDLPTAPTPRPGTRPPQSASAHDRPGAAMSAGPASSELRRMQHPLRAITR